MRAIWKWAAIVGLATLLVGLLFHFFPNTVPRLGDHHAGYSCDLHSAREAREGQGIWDRILTETGVSPFRPVRPTVILGTGLLLVGIAGLLLTSARTPRRAFLARAPRNP